MSKGYGRVERDNGERGNVKPDVHHGARQAYWASVLFLITPKRRAHGASVPTDQSNLAANMGLNRRLTTTVVIFV